jgi:hypothetical protein
MASDHATYSAASMTMESSGLPRDCQDAAERGCHRLSCTGAVTLWTRQEPERSDESIRVYQRNAESLGVFRRGIRPVVGERDGCTISCRCHLVSLQPAKRLAAVSRCGPGHHAGRRQSGRRCRPPHHAGCVELAMRGGGCEQREDLLWRCRYRHSRLESLRHDDTPAHVGYAGKIKTYTGTGAVNRIRWAWRRGSGCRAGRTRRS